MLKIYEQYKKHGVDLYYQKFNCEYNNPHSDKIKDIFVKYILDELKNQNGKHITSIIDIACGSGLISEIAADLNLPVKIKGSDPYFTNKYCHYNYSFKDISVGKLTESFDIAICCYAYHLIKKDLQYSFLTNLYFVCQKFIIISPSKKIYIEHPMWKIANTIRDNKITLIILYNNKVIT